MKYRCGGSARALRSLREALPDLDAYRTWTVRLPKEFRFEDDEVIVRRSGDGVLPASREDHL
ncbi:MAG: hypothetical protein HY526_13755 [Betaproteobacteria bacterium]|nr:hypothetical protein [Betaproteobacteria bacterium]